MTWNSRADKIAIACRICHTNVKKVGVLCQTCGLISHSACAAGSTTRCDAHEQYALYVRQQEYLQSAASSRYVSPQPSLDNLESGKAHNFPGKLLQNIKRSSKAALRSSSSVDLSGEIRRRKSSNHTQSGQARPILEARNLSSPTPASSHNSRQSRASMVSNSSVMTDDVMEDGRRRSAIRFELKEEEETGVGGKGMSFGVERAMSPVGRGYAQPSGSGRKDKSDCVLQ